MLFKEDFLSEGAARQNFLFNLGPLLAFGPAFCLFAGVIPMSPEVFFFGKRISLQVLHVDWGILYVFALASIGVFGTALAGWASDNKFSLLGGLRASAQMIRYEVTLGLTLVGGFIAFGSLRLDTMTELQGATEAAIRGGGIDPTLLYGWLPAWGIFLQPIAAILFLIAAMAESSARRSTRPRARQKSSATTSNPRDEERPLPHRRVRRVGGGRRDRHLHLPRRLAPALDRGPGSTSPRRHLEGRRDGVARGVPGLRLRRRDALSIWLMFLARWALARFRYDQVIHLGWK